MRAGDESFERLRAAIDELTVSDASALLAEARAEARALVRSRLTEVLADSLLERVREQLDDRTDLDGARAGAPRQPVSERAATSSRSRTEAESAWYVYGVLSASDVPLDGLSGVDAGGPVTAVAEGSLAAVVSTVSAEEFAEARLRDHLGDMEWVEAMARAHERVLDAVTARSTVIPMRMCTVYRTTEAVRDMLRREEPALSDALLHLRGKKEWSVKATYHRGRAVNTQEMADDSRNTGAGAGASYMRDRRRERDRNADAAEVVDAACARIHERLAQLSAEATLAPLRRAQQPDDGEMLLNGVYLVEDAAEDAFHSEVEALQASHGELGLELQTTGPWPPYNFVPPTLGAAL